MYSKWNKSGLLYSSKLSDLIIFDDIYALVKRDQLRKANEIRFVQFCIFLKTST